MKNKVKELRNKRGVSQTELANAVGTTKRTIYSIETEKSDIHLSLASKLAAYFGCGIDELFGESDGKYAPADRAAVWYVHVVSNTAEALGKPINETAHLLENSGLAKRVVSSYNILRTQCYENLAEVLSERLSAME
jgi:putative transcriptional regulator